MTTFIGNNICKVDAKGRILLPSAFKKQMDSTTKDHFVVKKDIYEKCLILYSMEEWQRQNDIIRKNTNPYNKEHNKFLRNFYNGTAEVALDASNRILIPKFLLDDANIKKEVVMTGQDLKIEIWAKEIYDSAMESGDDFAALADKIMGNINNET